MALNRRKPLLGLLVGVYRVMLMMSNVRSAEDGSGKVWIRLRD